MARSIRFLVKDIEEATVQATQEACVEIMNGLVEAGPGYTGEFSSAWYAVPRGRLQEGQGLLVAFIGMTSETFQKCVFALARCMKSSMVHLTRMKQWT